MRAPWVVLGLVLVVAALVTLVLAKEEPMHTQAEDTLVITEADIALVRRLPVIWTLCESGAPAVFETEGKALGEDRVDEYRRVMRTAEVLTQLGAMMPGRYEYDNPLNDELSAEQPFIANRRAEIHAKRVTIEVTEAHLKLLRAANIQTLDDGGLDIGVQIDCKRPYGNMSYFELDMGDILGIPPEGPPRKDRPELRDFSEAQLERFAELHEQTQPVLQVLLQHATLEPGRYVQRPAGYGRWKRA